MMAVAAVFLAQQHAVALQQPGAALDGLDFDAFDVELDQVFSFDGNLAVVEQIVERDDRHILAAAIRSRGDAERFMLGAGQPRGAARLSGTKHEALSIAAAANGGGEDVPVIALDNLLDDGTISVEGKSLIKLDVEGVEVEAIKGGTRLLQGDSVLLCEEHGSDRHHTVSRYILDQTPLQLIVYDPRSNRLETVTELSILDRIKVSTHVGYNVFGTASAFWQNRISALNANAARRMQ